jgi:integrase
LERLTPLKALALSGELGEPQRMKVAAFLDGWLIDTARKRVRASTYDLYRGVIQRHILKYIGGVALARLTPHHVRSMLTEMETAAASLRLQQITFGILRLALKQAVKDGSIPRNPCDAVDAPKVPRPIMQTLDVDQATRLLGTAENDRLHALYTLALSVGMREGEMFGLTWPNVNLKDGTLQITQQLGENNGHPSLMKPKTKSAVRQIDLPAIALLALREHRQRALANGTLNNPMDLVFTTRGGKPLRRSNFLRREFIPLLERAGIFTVESAIDEKTGQMIIDGETGQPKTKKVYIRFHCLRHSCASLALNAKVPLHVVSRMLGHARPSITADIYAHCLPGQGQEAAQAIDAVFTTTRTT